MNQPKYKIGQLVDVRSKHRPDLNVSGARVVDLSTGLARDVITGKISNGSRYKIEQVFAGIAESGREIWIAERSVFPHNPPCDDWFTEEFADFLKKLNEAEPA